MAHEHRGKVWFVRGIDSYNKEEDIWCNHSPNLPLRKIYKPTYLDTEVVYFECLKCGRQFQNIHPITAEEIIRDKDLEIQRLMEMISNV